MCRTPVAPSLCPPRFMVPVEGSAEGALSVLDARGSRSVRAVLLADGTQRKAPRQRSGRERRYNTKYRPSGAGASAGAGVVAHVRGGLRKVALRGSGGHRERVIQELGSGARAL
eukprot:6208972-Pleurochrysis_carterae.AAC.1